MIVLMDGDIHVHYGFAFLHAVDDDPPDLDETRAGQANGLCGAAAPGALSLMTGLHTGGVPFTVEWHDTEPPVGDDWPDVVEASFTPTATHLTLSAFDDHSAIDLPRDGDLRVRYCAIGMDEANAADVRMDGEPSIDRYLLQLWPQPPGPDAILRESSAQAGYWNGRARDTAPPPDPAERERQARLEAEEQRRQDDEQRRWQRDYFAWGGPAPSEPLQAAGTGASMLVRQDRDLAERLAATDSATQQAVMLWCVRRVCALADASGDPTVDWSPAIQALAAGHPVPPPYDDPHAVYAALPRGPVRVTTTVHQVVDASRRPVIHPPAAAMATIAAAQDANPLEAACGAVVQAASAFDDRAAFRQELQETFGLT